jgi:hypothetical protein
MVSSTEKQIELYTINLKNFPRWKSKQMIMFNENCSVDNLHGATHMGLVLDQ